MSNLAVTLIVAFIVFDVLIFGGLWLLGAYSKANRPDNVGRGHLADGTGKPNWVSSLARNEKFLIEPLTFTGDPEKAWAAAQAAITAMEKTEIVESTETYLYAECSSRIFGFVDDLELVLRQGESRIDVRSASRVGHSDMGANRTRVEKLRAMFQAELK